MKYPAKLSIFGFHESIVIGGHFFFVLGVLGAVIATIAPESSALVVLRFSLEMAGVWFGLWLVLYRIPPVAWTIGWCVIGIIAAWFKFL